MKIVKRTYVTKTGKKVTKIYKYDKTYAPKRGGKNLLLVNSKGNIYKDRVDNILNNIEDPIDRIEIEALIEARAKDKKSLKVRTLKAIMEEDRRTKIFINAGYNNLEDAAAEIGVNTSELLNEKNWKGSIFTNPITGLMFVFNVTNYHGSAWSTL